MEAWLPVRSANSVVAEILALGPDAEVVAPAELRNLVRQTALEIAELHRGDQAGISPEQHRR